MTLTHPALPPVVSRPWIAVAAAAWALAAAIANPHPSSIFETGPFEGEVLALGEPTQGRYGVLLLADTSGATVLLELAEDTGLGRGDRAVVAGVIRPGPGRLGGRPYEAVIRVSELSVTEVARDPVLVAGRWVRQRVTESLLPYDSGRALLGGFLIGDIRHVDPVDVDAMRKSGLAHFVAVSGSNVALFLGLLFIAAGPLATDPRRRAIIGLAGIPVYAAVTGFEPSVLRASVTAGLALAGRLAGVTLEAWQLLSLAVGGLVALQPWLTASAGFQLSVAATIGVLLGSRWPLSGGKLARALAVTIGAQAAVAPLILVHFGTVPLLSPLANLVAAPLVAMSTVLGAVGVLGVPMLTALASWLASIVLLVARGAAGWPVVDWGGLLIVVTVAALVHRFKWLRVPVAIVVSAVAVLVFVLSGPSLPEPSVVVLDVGQGDAILLNGGGGRFGLVDGGPDPTVLVDRLRRYGVSSLEIVVLTHVHADHATGLLGVVGRTPIGVIWSNTEPHVTGSSTSLLGLVDDVGLAHVVPDIGQTYQLGALEIRVSGPLRRYASPNDQSIVLEVIGPRRTMLLAGDIEVIAQRELPLTADVLKVPHQGAATSDAGWLVEVGAELAVISVGPNNFGHPAEWVIKTLEESGAEVLRTDEVGDVIVDLG